MDRNLKKYHKQYCVNHEGFESIQVKYRRKNLIQQLPKDLKGLKILEVGCGLDPFFQYINLNNCEAYIIVEPCIEFYQYAKPKIRMKNAPIQIFNQYIENFESDMKFDFIIISALLHEVVNPLVILKNIKNFMHKDTVLYINVPNAKSFHRVLAYESGIISSFYEMSTMQISLQQKSIFDLSSLSKLVQEAGLKIKNSGSFFVKPFTHEQMSILIDNKILPQEILLGLDNMIKYCPELGSEIFMTCMAEEL
ncbi:class I SAM-dependent methyltransferase [Wohlfahrtiimonas chitiniclastica]|uniref:class I SAM-dependent methyltransferase n=1 Tax=Wohlfahrtiimonas chitiniclastica TaxID=400946 RepID=UPI001BCC898C|nr:class I SAM-dependent methyltransferase [Wohlfahrtiimonas chitiniclastica]MBS7820814.1 class I SAM-dependent methyltransferase [Wohlfahrtiimonas chitiniclastica]MBS7838742.1 class I SAM-dependent methyltransferase [Wohlfahrtiimonas chitiniclastica]